MSVISAQAFELVFKMKSPQIENGYTKIANELLDVLARTRISGQVRQVVDYVIRQTYGYKTKERRLTLEQFMLGTGLNKQHCCRAISKAHKMKLIIIKIDNRGRKSYLFNKHYTEWEHYQK